jgi:hypothetical protein
LTVELHLQPASAPTAACAQRIFAAGIDDIHYDNQYVV